MVGEPGVSGTQKPPAAQRLLCANRRGTAFVFHRKEIKLLPFGSNKQSAFKTANLKVGIHPLELTPTLQPLAKIKDKVTLITGLDRDFQPGTDVHARCLLFLTSAAPYSGSDRLTQARTLDRIIAEQSGQRTFRTRVQY